MDHTLLPILNRAQLEMLASILWHQEVEAAQYLQFGSATDQDVYLRDCKSNHDSINKILEQGTQVMQKYEEEGEEDRSSIAHDIYKYVENCINFALQTVRNYQLRKDYLAKISEHAGELVSMLSNSEQWTAEEVRDLAKTASSFRNVMLDYTREFQSPASRSFSQSLKESGISFEQLVERYKGRLGPDYSGPFELLSDDQKITVYNDIIGASGRGNWKVNFVSRFMRAAGLAVLLASAGLMVWDIFTAEHVYETAVSDAIITVASIGGAILGEVVGVMTAEAIGLSATFAMVAGIVSGIIGCFIIGAFAGWIADYFFGSGGATPVSTDGLHCYVQKMPDTVELARQIAQHY